MSDEMESWVEDLADMEGENHESYLEADFGDSADEAEDQDAEGEDAEGRASRRRRRARRRIARAQARNYGRGVRGVAGGLVRTPSGDAQIALPQPVPSLKEFQLTVGQIQAGMKKNSDGIQQLEAQQRRDAAHFESRVAELKRDIVRGRKHAALVGVAAALAPVMVRLVQQQTEPEPTPAANPVG
jgi:hypothetical protein